MPIYKTRLINQFVSARNTIVCEFEKPDGFVFKPGQFGTFFLPQESKVNGSHLSRRFSLLYCPSENKIGFVTRLNSQSAYKKALLNLTYDETMKFIGPIGEFTLHKDHETPAVFIAGGVGIAPFYSIISALKDVKNSPKIYLFYGCYSIDDMPFLNELRQISIEQNKIFFIPIIEKANENWVGEIGYVSEFILRKYISYIDKPNYYICGSPKMVAGVKLLLNKMMIKESHIKTEDFPGY